MRARRDGYAFLLGLPFSVAIGDALAQATPPPPSAPATVLEQVQVTGAQDFDDRRDAVSARIVVTGEEIRKHGDSTLADALKRLPGVTVGPAQAQGQGREIRLRGLGRGYTQILLDGEPAPAGFSLDSLAPDLVERIEVMRVAGADMSTQSIAGTINVVLRKQPAKTRGDLKLALGSEHGEPSMNASANRSGKRGTMAYAVSGAASRTFSDRNSRIAETAFDADGDQVLERSTERSGGDRIDAATFTATPTWKYADNSSLALETFVRLQRVEGDTHDRSATTLGAPPTYASSDIAFRSRSGNARSKLSWRRQVGTYGQLEARLGVTYAGRESDVRFDGYDADGVYILQRDVRGDTSETAVNHGGKYSTPLADSHALVTGWDGDQIRRNEERLQRDFTPTGRPPQNIDEAYVARVQRLALFVQDDWAVTPRWSTQWGLRWEGLRTDTDGTGLDDVRNTSSVVSPVAQSVWRLPGSERDQVRLGLARTYKAPQAVDLVPRRFIANNNSPTSPDTQGNPELRPELAWGLDLSLEHYPDAGGLLSANVFARRIDDVILSRLRNVDGIWIASPANSGGARIAGVELEAKGNLQKLLPGAPAVELRFNATRTWSRVDDVPGPGNRLDQQVPFSANLGADYAFGKAAVGATLAFQNGGYVRTATTQAVTAAPRRAARSMRTRCGSSARRGSCACRSAICCIRPAMPAPACSTARAVMCRTRRRRATSRCVQRWN